MEQSGGKILQFEKLVKERENKKLNKNRYHCFVTSERLKGSCELLILDKGQYTAELFYLNFSTKGLQKQRCFYQRKDITEWMNSSDWQRITYPQALGLLGDAVRQNYKYQKQNEWIYQNPSVHLQRIWDDAFYNQQDASLAWMLKGQDVHGILQIYLRALRNQDAVLIYDMLAEQAKPKESRELYAMYWSHPLDAFSIFHIEVVDVQEQEDGGYLFFLIAYSAYDAFRILSVDMRVALIYEKGMFCIQQELVLESRLLAYTRVLPQREEQIGTAFESTFPAKRGAFQNR
jgi:hypothetical protein